MKDEAGWSAANDHSRGARPRAPREWVRPHGQTWYRHAPPGPDAREPTPRAARPEHRLIAAGRVVDAAVYSPQGRRVGRIEEIAIDDATGEVAFVLLAEGGFLGIGGRLRRVPWSALSYRAGRGGYVVDVAAIPQDLGLGLGAIGPFQPPADRGGWATGA